MDDELPIPPLEAILADGRRVREQMDPDGLLPEGSMPVYGDSPLRAILGESSELILRAAEQRYPLMHLEMPKFQPDQQLLEYIQQQMYLHKRSLVEERITPPLPPPLPQTWHQVRPEDLPGYRLRANHGGAHAHQGDVHWAPVPTSADLMDNFRQIREQMARLPVVFQSPRFILSEALGLLPPPPPSFADLTRWPLAVAMLRLWAKRPWNNAPGLILADWLEEHSEEPELGPRLRQYIAECHGVIDWSSMTRTRRREVLNLQRGLFIEAFGDFTKEGEHDGSTGAATPILF